MTGSGDQVQVDQQGVANHTGRKLVLKFKGTHVKELLAGKRKGLVDASNNDSQEKKEQTPPEEEEHHHHHRPTTARPRHPLGPPAGGSGGSSSLLGSGSGKRHKSRSLAYLASTIPPIEVDKSYISFPLMPPQDTATTAAMLAVNRSGDVPAISPFAAHTQQKQQQYGAAIVRKRVPAPHAAAKLLAAQRQQQDEYIAAGAPPPLPPLLQNSQYHHPKKHAVPGSSNGNGCTTSHDTNGTTSTVHRPGSLVWIKLGSYPWWPGQIQHPTFDQKRLKHNQGEDVFVVFYGSKDYCWVPSNDVKPFSKALPEYTKFAGVKNNKLQRAIDDAWVAMGRVRPDVAGRPYD